MLNWSQQLNSAETLTRGGGTPAKGAGTAFWLNLTPGRLQREVKGGKQTRMNESSRHSRQQLTVVYERINCKELLYVTERGNWIDAKCLTIYYVNLDDTTHMSTTAQLTRCRVITAKTRRPLITILNPRRRLVSGYVT